MRLYYADCLDICYVAYRCKQNLSRHITFLGPYSDLQMGIDVELEHLFRFIFNLNHMYQTKDKYHTYKERHEA